MAQWGSGDAVKCPFIAFGSKLGTELSTNDSLPIIYTTLLPKK